MSARQLAWTLLLSWLSTQAVGIGLAADQLEYFERHIRPTLIEHCYECHSGAKHEPDGGLRLDFRDGWRQGGDSGAAIVPGDPQASLLIQAIRQEGLQMPPAGRLPEATISAIEGWIDQGAFDPREQPPSPTEIVESTWKLKLAERKGWWSLQPPRHALPPVEQSGDWALQPIDQFVLSQLTQAGLEPAPPADAETFARRLSFVLTGLPPTAELLQEFTAAYAVDPHQAIEQLTDQLLASPHFGERFARHWMDVVRYTDTFGYEWDNPAKGSWEYRDYLIRAFNADVGLDQLIREQLAGDLLPEPRRDSVSGLVESLIGPMFYHLGEHRHGTSLDFNGIHQEMIDNKIDALSKTFLAMTVACSRCHDHKLDAISQRDYYALAGVLMTPRWTVREVTASDHQLDAIRHLQRLRDEIRGQLADVWRASVSTDRLSGAAIARWAAANREAIRSANWDSVDLAIARLLDTTQAEAVDDDAVQARWRELAEQWRTEQQQRRVANRQFQWVSDFRSPDLPDDWSVEGRGWQHGYVADGQILIALDGDRLIDAFMERGYHTRALSSKLAGALRLPDPATLTSKYLSLRLAGGQWAGRIVVPQNAFQAEEIQFWDSATAPAWQTLTAQPLKHGVTRVLTEFATASLHPNFPPRTGLARAGNVRLPDEDLGVDKRSWLSLTGIVAHELPGAPADTLEHYATLWEGPPPRNQAEAGEKIARWLARAVERWLLGQSLAGDVRILNWLLNHGWLPNDAQDGPEVARLVAVYRQIENGLDFPRTAMSMDERAVQPIDYRLNVRGDVDSDGPAVARGFLQVFEDQQTVARLSSSGRLELANYLASRHSPQTARVYVNRVWQWLFGKGLVATPNDFGKLGDRPSHPELLDWLAIQFMEDGWSTKRLIRQLVLSQTFRQSGQTRPLAAERDPDNRWLHHYPTRRLEAEAIRDNLLAVSGQLDRQFYGPPINPPRPAEDSAKRLFSGPWNGQGRRSLYTSMSIMEPPRFLVAFNLPDLKQSIGRRDQTNVPGQALVMLNDPLVNRLAEHWSKQLVAQACISPEARLVAMFTAALGRTPTSLELQRWSRAVNEFAHDTGDAMDCAAAWSTVAHSLFNSQEFIYYR